MQIHNIYHRYEISSQTMMYVKLIRAQFEEGSYLIIFRNRVTRCLRRTPDPSEFASTAASSISSSSKAPSKA